MRMRWCVSPWKDRLCSHFVDVIFPILRSAQRSTIAAWQIGFHEMPRSRPKGPELSELVQLGATATGIWTLSSM